MRLGHRVGTSATPNQVWEVLGNPERWPEFEPFLRRVRGAHRGFVDGQTLVGVSRIGSLALPIDVLEVEEARRLVLRVHTAPGVRQTLTYEVTPVVTGGSHLRLCVLVEGLLAPVALGTLWASGALTTRLLAARVERLARAARHAA